VESDPSKPVAETTVRIRSEWSLLQGFVDHREDDFVTGGPMVIGLEHTDSTRRGADEQRSTDQ
jgi:hypothetical protein